MKIDFKIYQETYMWERNGQNELFSMTHVLLIMDIHLLWIRGYKVSCWFIYISGSTLNEIHLTIFNHSTRDFVNFLWILYFLLCLFCWAVSTCAIQQACGHTIVVSSYASSRPVATLCSSSVVLQTHWGVMPNFSCDIHAGFLLISFFSKHGVPKETIHEHFVTQCHKSRLVSLWRLCFQCFEWALSLIAQNCLLQSSVHNVEASYIKGTIQTVCL